MTLKVSQGRMCGREFTFDAHDTFVFGRAPDCHIAMPEDDKTVSRHHFLLEVNPPEAVLRDLGSLNGTWVNGVNYGGRGKGRSPEAGARQYHPEVRLKHGDRIRVGETVLTVAIETPAMCCRCGKEIPDSERQRAEWGGAYLCERCYFDAEAEGEAMRTPALCVQCHKDVSGEISLAWRGDYLCAECREQAERDPGAFVMRILERAGTRLPAEAPEVGGYVIETKLGRGGCGVVYRARRRQDGQAMAFKVMLARMRVDEKAHEKFRREIESLKNLRHPNIVRMLDHGSVGSAFYFVMELCEGGSVADWMTQSGGRLSMAQAAPVMLQALHGLAYAHRQGFVHRDLKPGNILLARAEGQPPQPVLSPSASVRRGGCARESAARCGAAALAGRGAEYSPRSYERSHTEQIPPGGREDAPRPGEGEWIAKIGDFGMAKSFQQAGLSGMTMTGDRAGTPQFMPREQVLHFRQVKPVSDVWSLGATFYSMLTGQMPKDFPRGVDPIEVVLDGTIVPIRQRDATIPEQLAHVIDHALASKPPERFQDASEFLHALEKVL